MTYARDPLDTDRPLCLCGDEDPSWTLVTPEFCPACGDPGKPAPEPPQGDITPAMFAHDDDYAQARSEARWDCRQPNPCCRESRAARAAATDDMTEGN
ncbi:MAG: hypothetical protein M3Y33_08560 [Actinomycetota bacterium]|nr:hypothetical protein [Actinomycetota bacterium]